MAGSLSQIELADGMMLNGSHTFFEAAADLMGLQVVLDLAKETEAFDYDLFFQTLGRKFYRSFMTRDEAISDYESNGHPAHFVRANYIFAQVDEFYLAYPAIQEGTGMYCAPENRVSLW
jgi:predicted metalloendopeptidase